MQGRGALPVLTCQDLGGKEAGHKGHLRHSLSATAARGLNVDATEEICQRRDRPEAVPKDKEGPRILICIQKPSNATLGSARFVSRRPDGLSYEFMLKLSFNRTTSTVPPA